MKPTKEIAVKLVELLSFGLVRGLGVQKPGEMCVEAALCCALGLPHSDNPPCVSRAVRSFKIVLNDSSWSSNQARAKGMRRLAVAQLGSDSIDEKLFVKEMALAAIRLMVPIALRAAAKRNPKYAANFEMHALKCEQSVDLIDGRINARAAREAATADATAYATAYAATYAAYAYTAATAAYAATAADARDEVLALMTEAGVQALIKCKSPGCEWLDVCEEAA